MEMIIELVMDILLGGAVEFVIDEKTPKRIRIALLLFLSVFYIIFMLLLLFACMESDAVLMKLITGALALLFIFLFARLWWKVLRGRGE